MNRWWTPLLVSVLLLGPVLFVHGYLLTYDMVWVPDLAMRSDFLGLGSGIPRAVPSDAWVAVLDELVPGMLLQKLVLLASLLAGGVGIQRWASDGRITFGSTAATLFYLWNPYVVERLAIGHWPMLVCYGLLPWLARSAAQSVSGQRLQPGLFVLLPFASLSASAGVASAVVVLAFMVRARSALLVQALGALLLANLPWIAAGLVKAGTLSGVAASAEVFAPRGEGPLPVPLTVLTLGGVWNSEVVPYSRTTVLAWISVVIVVIAFLAGWPRLREKALAGWWVSAATGWTLALIGWAAPGAIDTLARVVPGAGVLRDGSRLLLLAAPILAIALGAATDRLVDRVGEAGPILSTCLMLLPVAAMPDAAWGMTNQLRPVHYPSSYAAMSIAVADLYQEGDVLVLPFTAYRAPEWNDFHKVFDPVGRFQSENYLASDELAVSGNQLAGEDPRDDTVMAALREATPTARGEALAGLGIGMVVTDKTVAAIPGQASYVAEVAGVASKVVSGFDVVALGNPAQQQLRLASRMAVWGSWVLYLAAMAWGWGRLLARVARKSVREHRLSYTHRQNLGGN